MPRRGHSEEQIVFALKQVENGAKVPEVCRKLGISDQTFYRWKQQYEGMGVPECTSAADEVFEGPKIPTVLKSGDHEATRLWRLREAMARTKRLRLVAWQMEHLET